jgi:hypothetical protein
VHNIKKHLRQTSFPASTRTRHTPTRHGQQVAISGRQRGGNGLGFVPGATRRRPRRHCLEKGNGLSKEIQVNDSLPPWGIFGLVVGSGKRSTPASAGTMGRSMRPPRRRDMHSSYSNRSDSMGRRLPRDPPRGEAHGRNQSHLAGLGEKAVLSTPSCLRSPSSLVLACLLACLLEKINPDPMAVGSKFFGFRP